jgi:hypothetical protein
VTTSDPDWAGSTPENVSHSSTDRARQPDIAIDSSGEAVTTWTDEWNDGTDRQDIFFASNTGSGWSAPQIISNTVQASRLSDVLAVDDKHFVAWVDGSGYSAREVFETEIGTSEIRTIPCSANPELTQPSLAASADRLHIAFSAKPAGTPHLYHSSRSLTGGAWQNAAHIYTPPIPFESINPALAAAQDENLLHLVWEIKSLELRSVMYMSGTVSGAAVSWSPAITLSTGITFSMRPDIAVASNGDVHVTWGETVEEDYNEQYVRYIRYDADSGTWDDSAVRIDPNPVRVNEESPTYIGPAIALWEDSDETQVCMAWHGFRDDDVGPGAEEILLRCSSDGGNSWPSATENVSRSTTQAEWEFSIRPRLAFDTEGTLHIVWQERAGSDVTTDYEVYYSASSHRIFLPLVLRNY